MTPALASPSIIFSEAEMQAYEVGIQEVAARLSARELAIALRVSWAEYVGALRKVPSSVTAVPDSELEKYYQACQRIFTEQLAMLNRAHWTAGSA